MTTSASIAQLSNYVRNPVGITAGHIRPLTNKDYGNVFPTKFGLARPMKHYRRGRHIPILVPDTSPGGDPTKLVEVQENSRNMNRSVKSSKGSSLGGGGGGSGMISNLITNPGSVVFFQNDPDDILNGTVPADNACIPCNGIGVTSSYSPNVLNLTNNPARVTQSAALCCSIEKKALLRCRPASTIISKKYYSTYNKYQQGRCLTHAQRSFNFEIPTQIGGNSSQSNAYYANCPSGSCKVVIYKPSNQQFAVQGAVDSSTRSMKLKIATIQTNLNSFSNNSSGKNLTAATAGSGDMSTNPFIYKNKGSNDCVNPRKYEIC